MNPRLAVVTSIIPLSMWLCNALYTSRIDPAFVVRVYEACGRRPMLWSEFFYGSASGSGLSGSRDIATQEARGLAYRNYVEAAASFGYVIGIEWFTLIDQPVTGRYFEEYTGESFNTGLFSVTDRPYKPMITEMAKTNFSVYDVWLEGKKPSVFINPLFKPKP